MLLIIGIQSVFLSFNLSRSGFSFDAAQVSAPAASPSLPAASSSRSSSPAPPTAHSSCQEKAAVSWAASQHSPSSAFQDSMDDLSLEDIQWERFLLEHADDPTVVHGNIHDPQVYPFWQDTLQAGEWSLRLLREGYRLPFSSLPSPYYEKNNRSALNFPDVVEQQLQQLLDSGALLEVFSQPTCVSPLSLITRTLPDGSLKHRLY